MERLRKYNKLLIAFFILLQPMLDVFRRLVGANFEILGISALELVNICLIGLIFLLTIITYSEKKRLLKWLFILIPYIIYFIIHFYNTTQFNNGVYPEQYVSIVSETYYLIRMFVLPLIFLFSMYYSGIDKRDLYQILELFVLIVAGSIIILNIAHVSFLTYDDGYLANYSIFEWTSFIGDNFQKLATNGWFYSGNQMSAILFILFPITLYLAYNKQTKYNYFLLIIQIVAMMILGTKIANIGCILILVVFVFIVLFKRVILKKEIKPIIYICCIIVLSFGLFIISPRGYDLLHKEYINKNIKGPKLLISEDNADKINEISCNLMTKEDEQFLKYFMFFNQNKLRFPDYFVQSYPVEYNYSFWCYMVQGGIEYRNQPIDYRVMKTAMLKQIYIQNHNDLDKFFGMGYTLNFIYTEEDYTYQFYSYGIFGLLLFIFPYLLICVFTILKFLKNFKQNFTMENVLVTMSLVLGVIVPYLSGHVLERSFPLYILTFICAFNLILYQKRGIDGEKTIRK